MYSPPIFSVCVCVKVRTMGGSREKKKRECRALICTTNRSHPRRICRPNISIIYPASIKRACVCVCVCGTMAEICSSEIDFVE